MFISFRCSLSYSSTLQYSWSLFIHGFSINGFSGPWMPNPQCAPLKTSQVLLEPCSVCFWSCSEPQRGRTHCAQFLRGSECCLEPFGGTFLKTRGCLEKASGSFLGLREDMCNLSKAQNTNRARLWSHLELQWATKPTDFIIHGFRFSRGWWGVVQEWSPHRRLHLYLITFSLANYHNAFLITGSDTSPARKIQLG